jgi:hypothetical protein
VYALPLKRQWCKLMGMLAMRTGTFAPVTLGHTRSQRCRDLLIYFNSGHCNLSTTMCVRNAAVSVHA